ncbi:hypothetical protein HanPI659440_Chr01g0012171 [Helianthus annuus]|nr:hypothetical protein HanPI659440_Chr01g0012171 [Helianthus annuus]
MYTKKSKKKKLEQTNIWYFCRTPHRHSLPFSPLISSLKFTHSHANSFNKITLIHLEIMMFSRLARSVARSSRSRNVLSG